VYVSESIAVHIEPAIYSGIVRLNVMKCVREFTSISENTLGGAILTATKNISLLRNAIQRHTIRNTVENPHYMFNEVLKILKCLKIQFVPKRNNLVPL